MELGITNLFYGAPGTGKSCTAVYTAQCLAEVWMEELQNKMLDIESEHRKKNFAKIRLSVYNSFLKWYEKTLNQTYEQIKPSQRKPLIEKIIHQKRKSIWNLLGLRTTRKAIKKSEDMDFYKIMESHFEFETRKYGKYEKFEIDYMYYFFASYLDNMINANLPIFDKKKGLMSSIINYKWFSYRAGVKNERLIMPYHIYIIDEADKEFPSSNKKTKTDEDGNSPLALGFANVMKMFRHETHNKGIMIFITQIPSSLHFQIRANCEGFIQFYQHKKDSMPTILTKLLYTIVKVFKKFNKNMFLSYMKKEKRVKDTATLTNFHDKKNNNCFWKIFFLEKYKRWNCIKERMDRILQFKLFIKFYDGVELNKGKKSSLKINFLDIKDVYCNVFFFGRHLAEIMSARSKSICRKYWGNLTPSIKDLKMVGSTFYDSYFGISRPEQKKSEKKKSKSKKKMIDKKIVTKKEKKDEKKSVKKDDPTEICPWLPKV